MAWVRHVIRGSERGNSGKSRGSRYIYFVFFCFVPFSPYLSIVVMTLPLSCVRPSLISVSLNTGCILHETGKFSRYADLPTFSITTKGPTRLSANLAFGRSMFRFSESNQTRVPFVYSYFFVFLCLS